MKALLVAFALTLATAACDGPVGPQGDRGPQGPAGEDGQDGADGQDGQDGNANVVSDTFVVTDDDYQNSWWTLTTGSGSSYSIAAKIAEISVPAITDSIFSTGTVLVYLKVPEGLSTEATQWSPLPFMLRAFSVGYFNSIKYAYDVGVIHIAYLFEASDSDASVPSVHNEIVPDYEFKYVVIEGTLVSQVTAAGVNLDDVEEVQTFFRARNIPIKTGTFRASTP